MEELRRVEPGRSPPQYFRERLDACADITSELSLSRKERMHMVLGVRQELEHSAAYPRFHAVDNVRGLIVQHLKCPARDAVAAGEVRVKVQVEKHSVSFDHLRT